MVEFMYFSHAAQSCLVLCFACSLQFSKNFISYVVIQKSYAIFRKCDDKTDVHAR